MKIHYVYSQLHHATACGQDTGVNFVQTTTDASDVTCKSCLRCLKSYVQRISDTRTKYESVSTEHLLVNLIAMTLEDEYDSEGYSMTRYWYRELRELFFVLIERLKEQGIIEDVEWISGATVDLF